jgi:molybdopterin-containing oxidoreductase family iron-sulfur binding subunit
MGRYAKGRGANPFAILNPVFERKTGELPNYGTRVQLKKTGEHASIVKDEGWKAGNLKTQAGRKLVATLDVDVAKLASES